MIIGMKLVQKISDLWEGQVRINMQKNLESFTKWRDQDHTAKKVAELILTR